MSDIFDIFENIRIFSIPVWHSGNVLVLINIVILYIWAEQFAKTSFQILMYPAWQHVHTFWPTVNIVVHSLCIELYYVYVYVYSSFYGVFVCCIATVNAWLFQQYLATL